MSGDILDVDPPAWGEMTYEQAVTIIREEYNRLRGLWFPAASPPAQLMFLTVPEVVTKDAPVLEQRLQEVDGTLQLTVIRNRAPEENQEWGYLVNDDVLQCVIHEGELLTGFLDFVPPDESHIDMYIPLGQGLLREWAGWRVYLVHEMCHEYQHKALGNTPDQAGNGLHHRKCTAVNKPPKWPYPEAHPPAFFSAICNFAEVFQLNPDILHDRL